MRYTLVALVVLVVFKLGLGQCSFDVNSSINAGNNAQYDIEVSGLVLSDLSAGGILCAVNIDFDHPSILNLRVSLIGPDGTEVFLTGPATTNSTVSTFVDWDVSFIDCDNPASPDGVISSTWSNTSNWANGDEYTGSYYPSGGCFSDYGGDANGVWTLNVEDLGENNGGYIENVELVFCNPAGLSCQICDTQILNFDNPSEFFCDQQTITFDLETYFNVSSSQNVQSYLVLTDGDMIRNFIMNNEELALPEGVYNIYALAVPAGTDLSTYTLYSQLQTALSDGTICGASSDGSGFINVLAVDGVQSIFETLCPGEPFEVANTILTAPVDTTVYTLNIGGSCEMQFDVTLAVSESGLGIQQTIQEIECGDQIILTADELSTSINYMWATVDGSIVSGANTPIVTVNQPGTYYLFGDADCVASDSIRITAADTYDQLSISVVSNDCSSTSATLSLESGSINVSSVVWQGPGIDGSTDLSPTIAQNGDYSVQVFSDDFPCPFVTIYQSYDAITTTPVSILKANDLSCLITRTQLYIETDSEDILNVEWSNVTGAVFGYGLSVEVAFGGDFTAEVFYLNGCSEIYTITVLESLDLYQLAIGVKSIECTTQIGELRAFTDGPVASVRWNGPSGYTSNDVLAIVSNVGTYRVTVVYTDGCVQTTTVYIDYNEVTSPVISIPSQIIDCNNPEVTLTVGSGDDPNYCYLWEHRLLGTIYNGRNPVVNEVGAYSVKIYEDSNCSGVCFSEYNVIVLEDLQPPELVYSTMNVLNCNNRSVVLEATGEVNRVDDSSLVWTGPGIDASNANEFSPTVSVIGDYSLNGRGTNGCVFPTITVSVTEDIQVPIIDNEGAVFTSPCNNGITELSVQSTSAIGIYNWSGGLGTQATAMTSIPGDYKVTVTGVNFCSTEANYTVTQEDFFSLDIPNDMIGLGCNVPSETLTVSLLNNSVPNSPAMITSLIATSTSNSVTSLTTFPDDSGDLIFTEVGMYTIVAELDNGCILESSVTVSGVFTGVQPMIDAPSTIDCTNLDLATFSVTNPAEYTLISWNDENASSLSTDPIFISNDPTSIASLEVVDINGCSVEIPLSAGITIDTIPPSIGITMGISDQCQLDLTATSDEVDVQYNWTTNNGTILSVADEMTVTVASVGTYTCEILSDVNGCTDIDSINVDELTGLDSIEIIQSQPGCLGELITIDDILIKGASISLLGTEVFIDGYPWNMSLGQGFESGMYTLSLSDENGCTGDQDFEINSPMPFSLSIQDTFSTAENIPIVVSIDVQSSSNDPDDIIIDWSGNPESIEGLEATYIVGQAGDYNVNVTDNNGCSDNVSFHIAIDPSDAVYVPNIFKPGDSGVDGALNIYAITEGEFSMQVYDRWGNQIYNETATGTTVSWDGLFQGEKVEQGVYIVALEVLFTDGDTHRQLYDVTVIR